MPQLTSDQVLALAPDPASAKAGRDLANPAKWTTLGADAIALWGECSGSGASPYRTRVDLATTGYKCSCPSRKFPCKHVLGLLFIGAANAIPASERPDWVDAWLDARREKRDAKAAAPERVVTSADEATSAAAAAAASKRAAAREDRVALGLDELERWLCDIVRLGFVRVQSESPRFWDAKAARLVDAQAPGVARRVRALAGIAASGHGWEARMLDAFGTLFLLREAYARIDELEPARRADVRRYVGWTEKQEDVITRPGALVADRWAVLGTRTEEDERVIAHRAWLRGERTGREALVLQFAQPGFSVPHAFVPGTAFDGKLAFFPASVEQRAAVAERADAADEAFAFVGASVEETLARYAAHLAVDPWFETMSVSLAVTQTRREADAWFVCDERHRALPVARSFAHPFALHALCGGRPLSVAGEWNGRTFFPLAAWTLERYVTLS